MKKLTLPTASERDKERIEIAKIFIDRLRAKHLVTGVEAKSLEVMLEIIVREGAPPNKLRHEAERMLESHPGPIAGTIARATISRIRFRDAVRAASSEGG